VTVIPLNLLRTRPEAPTSPAVPTSPASGGSPAAASGCRAGSCGAPSTGLDPAIAAKVATHPCYSQDAHQYYARMHIPVAPGCNIQCNYCNRKFDCANESRPGVTSTLLSPDDAVAKVKHVASRVPQLSVIGVSGPGEPLANGRRTLGTLQRIAEEAPDLTLCLSTNGLTLLDHVDRIADLGIDHVTVTVNMTDPEVGERIYPWITFGGRRLAGREASRVLSERQLAGITALRERGILCKVNSVMIPGVNDEHLVEVSRTVRDLGVFLHNVMPLVSAPEHGTHFGLTGQRGPSPAELQALQDRCEELAGPNSATAMGLMRHCRQCRADAVGMLGEDRGEEFAASVAPDGDGPAPVNVPSAPYELAERQEAHARIEERRAAGRAGRAAAGVSDDLADRPGRTVLVAVATSGGGVVNQHFGHAEEFWVYEAGPGYARLVGTRSVARYCTGPSDCGDGDASGERSLERIAALLADCAAVLCTRAGAGPRRALAAAGAELVEVYDLIEPSVARTAERLLAVAAAPGTEEATA
jgi:nitrogen fixation protein NifB